MAHSAPSPVHAVPVFNEALLQSMINSRLSQIEALTTHLVDWSIETTDYLSKLGIDFPDFNVPDIKLDIPKIDFEELIAKVPTNPHVIFNLPHHVSFPPLDEVLVGDIVDPPPWTLNDPILSMPPAPAFVVGDPPNDIPVIDPVETPIKPVITLPDLPIFYTIDMPDNLTIDLPTFDAAYPTENLLPPDISIINSQEVYSSMLLSLTKDSLYDDLTSRGTGLDPAVEQAIYDRDSERSLTALIASKERTTDEWSRRGFILPDGVLVQMIIDSEKDFVSKRLDTSRDILIKQAELTQTNYHFIIENSLKLESTLIDYQHKMNELAFQMSVEASKVSVEVYNASVEKYKAQLMGYQARASVYESRIKGELAKAEVYKAQVDAVKATAEANKAYADIYRSQIEGVKGLMEMYKTEMEASKLHMENNKLRIEIFHSQIDGFTAMVQGRTAQVNLYRAQVDGEKAKVDIYKAQADAFSVHTDVWKKQADTIFDRAKMTITANNALIDGYKGQIEGYKARVQGESSRVDGVIKGYLGDVDAYKSQVGAWEVIVRAEFEAVKAKIELIVKAAEAHIKTAEMKIHAIIGHAQVLAEARKGAAQAASQMAAGALAGSHVSASLSATASSNESASNSASDSRNISENYSESKDLSKSTPSYSNSTSDNKQTTHSYDETKNTESRTQNKNFNYENEGGSPS